MFAFLGIVLTYALFTFGGVLPHDSLLLECVMASGFLGIVVVRAWRGEPVEVRVLGVLIVALGIGVWVSPRLGLPLFVGVWAFNACRVSDGRRVERFLQFLLLLGLAESILGLAQFFIAPGWIFGYINRTAISGTLINRNHFAGFLEMIIPVAMGLAYVASNRHRDVSRAYVYLLSGSLMSLALIFSASRMGIVSMFATVGFMATVIQLRSAERRLASILGFGLIGLVLIGGLWIGVDTVIDRYSSLLDPDLALNEGRLPVFRASLRLIVDNPWGVGVDRYRDVFRQYQTVRLNFLYDHAHNDYLESAAEWGVIPAVLFWSFVIGILVRSVQVFVRNDNLEGRGILLAGSGAMFSILLHSLTDFNLQIPSNAMLFSILAGVALAFASGRSSRGRGVRQLD
jgi:O-antigen ligase